MPDSNAPRGPVDFALVAFPANRFKGEVVPALKGLVDNGTVRILDLVFVEKAFDGTIVVLELSELDDATRRAFDDLDVEGSALLSDGDLELAAESFEPGNSALLVVWENTWATRMVHALRNADFRLLAHERISTDSVGAAAQPTVTPRELGRAGRPGLLGMAARTAAVAGTATAAAGGVSRHQHGTAEEQTPDDPIAQIKQLAELRDQGILTDDEFAAQKAKLLG
jgi:hypothetical protein